MFTGLVEELGRVHSVVKGGQSIRLEIEAEKVLGDVKTGDSIAVDGACLTVVAFTRKTFTADIMPETFRRTTLSLRKPGDPVNLERTLRLGDRFGGHIVSGHVDAVATLESVTPLANANILRIRIPPDLSPFMIPQGSVAVDGISLTIVDCGDDWFEVSLIPHTWAVTVLSHKKAGDKINIETDIVGKYIHRLIRTDLRIKGKDNHWGEEFLAKHGFLD